ncbi:glycoside hydrolase/phage tail family protein [Tropicibacter sp. R15_0]|uniref:baseplate multidomain protein megatron n=1 Tax=Tropicibacter sp. R15_0 TaxID=2821101 RepID=UPI001ADA9FBB|nr:glycoside hydrolase/phage tail family protein [Tropicibacter sp. R15_0]MBO9467068.1 glycoside hydrolase/phage tail family protein [Tropicibacter sp. R15_0]
MATVLFAGLGSALGASIGGGILGVSSAVIGQAIGATLGRAVDQRLLAAMSPAIKQTGPRLDNLEVMTSNEGAAIPEIAGRVAVAGEVIWATELKEVKKAKKKSVGSGKQKQKVKQENYLYFASLAIGLGRGPLAGFGRIWIDGNQVDLSEMIAENRLRFYSGSEDQMPDPLIEAVEGFAPAYRGLCYIVFEDLPLKDFGNRVPQIKVEVFGQSGELEQLVRGVNVIPGTTEWGYMPDVVMKRDVYNGLPSGYDDTLSPIFPGFGSLFETIHEATENASRHAGVSDWSHSMDLLATTLPQAETASLVVSWFGTDLRAGQCQIEPRLERRDKNTDPAWMAGGLTRIAANLVSFEDDEPNYGSSPADISVIEAIRDLRARGKRVVLYPFVMMDITDEQALPDPSGKGVQPKHPWRGRIMPEQGQSVSDEIAGFMGTAVPADFSVSGDVVSYSGPVEWRFRRFILHLAHLAAAAGGVDAFLIGSEMRGLSMAPDGPGQYPFVQALRSLAADVRTVLPGAAISYAADWSEYHSHQDGADLRFHLDPLWADPNIDFVGIDNYLPLSDWRSGVDHADYDAEAGFTTPYALDYLKANIEGGEYWDWYYASEADRATQIRTPITDGAHGEPWVYRQKAIRDWHANAHHERQGASRAATSTDWVPGSKPIWFTELGCPAVDNGANQPNVFYAAKSSETALPHFSKGVRDDFMQRQFLRASLEWWRDNGAGVVDIDNVQIWAWDARPWPEFPVQSAYWSDGGDWHRGHWLNGRAGAVPAAELIRDRLVDRHGLSADQVDVSACFGQIDGYPATAPIGFRDWLQPIEIGMGLHAFEHGGKLVVESRSAAKVAQTATEAVMVDAGENSLYERKRLALDDVAAVSVLSFIDGMGDYERRPARASIGAGREKGTAGASLDLVMDYERGFAANERTLRAAADGREAITFRLPRSATAIRPGVVLPLSIKGEATLPMMVERIVDGVDRQVELKSFSFAAYAATGGVLRSAPTIPAQGSGSVMVRFLDLPILPGSQASPWDTYIACHASPWPGEVSVAQSADPQAGFETLADVTLSTDMGELTGDLSPVGAALWQRSGVTIKLYSGSLVGRDELDVLNGANALAVLHPEGWEILQFRDAQLVGPGEWRISHLLRGRLGTDGVMGSDPLTTGAPVVVLDDSLTPLELPQSQLGMPLYYRSGPVDVTPDRHQVRGFTAQGVGLKPYAPCHFRVQNSGWDLSLSWIRRSRIDGDADWRDGVSDVPLGEVSEAYRLEVVSGGEVVRSEDLSAPSFLYSAAMAATDGVTVPYQIRVAQVSESYGPGDWAVIEISE